MWHWIEVDLAVDLPECLAWAALAGLEALLAKHARFWELHGD